MPEKTLEATADHAVITGDAVSGSYAQANAVLDELTALGVSYNEVVAKLEVEGLDKFEAAWNELLTDLAASLKKAGN
jgi:transaldolase